MLHPANPLLTYEDFTIGDVMEFGNTLVTRAAIVAFALEFDPQPFHLDEAAGEVSMLGGLCASGWHTASLLMRMSCDAWVNRTASWGGPGVEELKWLVPVRPGDVLRARRTVLDKRLSQSRPQMGLISLLAEVLNQHGAVVMTQRNIAMIGRRGAEQAASTPAARPVLAATVAATPGIVPVWFEDAEPGVTIPLGSQQFSASDIIRFAQNYDPQPFHLDEAAGRQSHFGGLVASGWHTASAYMPLYVRARQRAGAAAQARGDKLAENGPSPGVRDILWRAPVRPGDTISYSTLCTQKRGVTRPGWGLAQNSAIGINQHGQTVFSMSGAGFLPMRG